MTDEVERALRALACSLNIDAEKAVVDFRHGGSLAQMFRRLLAPADVKKSAGRPENQGENWRRFALVVTAKRLIEIGSVDANPFVYASMLGEQHDPLGDPEDRRPERYKGTYFKMKSKRGWSDEDVPEGLAALYSSPPRDRTPP